MQSFTVHRRRRTIGNPEAEADATVFVRDTFSWAAFIVPVLWALYHRLWLVLVGFIAVAMALNLAITLAGLPEFVNAMASLALQFLFAAEARDLRRWTLERRGYDLVAVIVAENFDQAETRYFREWTDTIARHREEQASGERVAFSLRAPDGGSHTPTAEQPA